MPSIKKTLTIVKIYLNSFKNTQKNWNWLFMSKSIYQLFQALWKVIAFEGLKKVLLGGVLLLLLLLLLALCSKNRKIVQWHIYVSSKAKKPILLSDKSKGVPLLLGASVWKNIKNIINSILSSKLHLFSSFKKCLICAVKSSRSFSRDELFDWHVLIAFTFHHQQTIVGGRVVVVVLSVVGL